jgi:hypothetical protein
VAAGLSAGTIVTSNALKPGTVSAPPTGSQTGPGAIGDALPNYAQVASADLSNPNGAQSFGDVHCPTGTVAFGGGVNGDSASVSQNVNSSFPEVSGGVATGWGAYMNNASGARAHFQVWAVCAKKSKQYAVVASATISNPTGAQTSGSVSCPLNSKGKLMKPFGGGALGASRSVSQNINTSIPVSKKTSQDWRVDMNNSTGPDSTFTVYAICGSDAGWKVVAGDAVANPANTQTSAEANCPSPEVTISGGEFSTSPNTNVNLHSTLPDGNAAWQSYDNNASTFNAAITPYAVCLSP